MTNGTQKNEKYSRWASLWRKDDCGRKTVAQSWAFILIWCRTRLFQSEKADVVICRLAHQSSIHQPHVSLVAKDSWLSLAFSGRTRSLFLSGFLSSQSFSSICSFVAIGGEGWLGVISSYG